MDSRNEISFASKPCISMHQLHSEFMNLFFTVSSFFFTNISGYTSTEAMRYSTMLASRVCPLRASIVVANFCSTDFLVFCFFGILLINKFSLFMFFYLEYLS